MRQGQRSICIARIRNLLIPAAGIVYNIAGLSPNKVARFNGDPRGKEFAVNIGTIGAYENSSHATTDFPLALLNIKRDIFSSVQRSLLPPQNIDSLELIADQVQLKVVPHYQDYQLKARNSQTTTIQIPVSRPPLPMKMNSTIHEAKYQSYGRLKILNRGEYHKIYSGHTLKSKNKSSLKVSSKNSPNRPTFKCYRFYF